METISEEYRELNVRLHASSPEYGANGHRNVKLVTLVAESFRSNHILDYGCGKGTLASALSPRGYIVCEYDPAIDGKDANPDPDEIVYCGDVAEHIEPEYLDCFLDDLVRVAKVAIILVVATRPAKKILADGRNAHLINEPIEWWLPKLKSRFSMLNIVGDSNEFTFIGKPCANRPS